MIYAPPVVSEKNGQPPHFRPKWINDNEGASQDIGEDGGTLANSVIFSWSLILDYDVFNATGLQQWRQQILQLAVILLLNKLGSQGATCKSFPFCSRVIMDPRELECPNDQISMVGLATTGIGLAVFLSLPSTVMFSTSIASGGW